MSQPKVRVVAIIQARMGSSRRPGKTLADISGKPLIWHVVERTRASQTVDSVVLATTTEENDQQLLKIAEEYGILGYAGSLNDVLDRFYQAACLARAEVIVRVTADDPFKDPQVIDKVVNHLLTHPELDYCSNTIEPTYPEGLDIEVFTFQALERAWNEAKLTSEREHVTPYIWKNPGKFNIHNVRHIHDLSALRWTLDYEEDLQFTREVYARLYRGQIFLMDEILALLAREPQLLEINQGKVRNAGYLLSLQQDAEQQQKKS
jgi:spore coat polysaccharide biosynthesis protein SpsF